MKRIAPFLVAWMALTLAVPQPVSSQSAAPPVAVPIAPSVIAGLDGDWDGALDRGEITLRLIFHVVTAAGTGTTATLDSIDQSQKGIPIAAVKKVDDRLSFDVKAVQGSFEGRLSSDGQTIVGTWRQPQVTAPLTLKRRAAGVAAPMPYRRPQNPVRPYPYREEQVTYVNRASADKVRLAGTLTLPQGKGPFPAVILIAGSGPNVRDEEGAGHKTFLVLSDHLTRQGIAVLRFDKRGVGASSGDYAKATALDFASDVKAGLAFLRSRGDIRASQIGLVGHSEGGLIAPMIAAEDRKVAFVVLMAGPGENGAKIALHQGELILRADGKSESAIAKSTRIRAAIFRIVGEEADAAKRDAALRRMLAAPDMAASYSLTPEAIDDLIRTFSTDSFHFIVSYEPAPTLARLRQPVLAIGGSLDLQVLPGENLAGIRTALARDKDVTVTELPGLNHLFQTAKTGSPSEYQTIEETIAPVALNMVSDWIVARVRPDRGQER